MKMMRLDRFLAEASSMTRSQVKDVIRAGRVRVCSAPAVKGDVKIDPAKDDVELDGERVYLPGERWIMLCKEEGYVTARKDDFSPCVTEFLGKELSDKVFPVGRLDIDTTGLLMICNDGELAHRLLSPARHVDKVYEAVVSGEIGAKEICMFAQGLAISEEWTCLPAKLKVLEGGLSMPDQAEDASRVSVTICEGKFHQIKRMFSKIDSQVLSLKRLSMGSLQLDDKLQPGQYRRLTREEIASLRIDAGLEKPDS